MKALFTDLYELTMMAGYYVAGLDHRATFELYVRDLPDHRAYLVAAGLEQALDYLAALRFTDAEIRYLRELPVFARVPPSFFDDYLPSFRFTGDVNALDEGTPVFAHEPIIQVTAPLPEAQLVETALLTLITFQTSIATKAARVIEAAAGRPVIEFGSRRAHGPYAAVHAARAAYLAGCAATSNAEAGMCYGIPVSGTMAHSWVMSFDDEIEAFRQYSALYGEDSILLIDTYDSLDAARRIIEDGLRPAAVRIDSGDVVSQATALRRMLDEGGLAKTHVFVSGDLDEHKILTLLGGGAPIDGFGVGTALATSSDAPALGGVYKLVEIERQGRFVPVLKRSPGKRAYPGRKQVWRRMEGTTFADDLVTLADEPGPDGTHSLLQPMMVGGERLHATRPIDDLRRRCCAQIASLPASVRRLPDPVSYPVRVSARLRAEADKLNRPGIG